LARIGEYGNADFQSLPPNIQYSMDQCNARPLVHTVQDLENGHRMQSSGSYCNNGKTVKSLIEESIDDHMMFKSMPHTYSTSTTTTTSHTMTDQQRSALSLIDEMLSHRSAASTSGVKEYYLSSSSEKTVTTGSSSLTRSPSQQSQHQQQHTLKVNTLSPNGSTINDAVAIFQSATIGGNSLPPATSTTVFGTVHHQQHKPSPSQSPTTSESLSSHLSGRKEHEKPEPVVLLTQHKSSTSTSNLSKIAESQQQPPKEQRAAKSSSPSSSRSGETLSPSKSSPALHKHVPVVTSCESCDCVNSAKAKDSLLKKDSSSLTGKKDHHNHGKDEAKQQLKEEKSNDGCKVHKHNKVSIRILNFGCGRLAQEKKK
jgi:hypothetical protein